MSGFTHHFVIVSKRFFRGHQCARVCLYTIEIYPNYDYDFSFIVLMFELAFKHLRT